MRECQPRGCKVTTRSLRVACALMTLCLFCKAAATRQFIIAAIRSSTIVMYSAEAGADGQKVPTAPLGFPLLRVYVGLVYRRRAQ